MRPNSPRSTALCILLIIFVTGFTFVRLCSNQFVYWDDHNTIARNPNFAVEGAAGPGRYWREPSGSLYIPVTYTVWGALAELSRGKQPDPVMHSLLDPWLFHAFNVLLHIATAVLVFLLLRKLMGADWPACLGALLFALHPVQVESVAWASGTKDLLAGFFGVLALLGYVAAARRMKAGNARAAYLTYSGGAVALLFAMLSKPSAVIVPAVVGVLELLLIRQSSRRASLWVAGWLALAVPFIVKGKLSQPATMYFTAPLWSRPLIAADALAFYLKQLIAPIHLLPDYGRSPRWLLQSGAYRYTWVVPVVVALACWLGRRRYPWLLAAFGVFVAALLPILGLVKFEFQLYSTVADHYLYFAMLGPALALAFLMSSHWKRIPVSLCAAALAVVAGRSFVQAGYWRDTSTLFHHVLERNPTSLAAQAVLGFMEQEAGHDAMAYQHFLRTLETEPEYSTGYFYLGVIELRENRPVEALAHLERANELNPDDRQVLNNLGIALARVGRFPEAVRRLSRVLELVPDYSSARTNLGVVYEQAGEPALAMRCYQQVLMTDPNDEGARRGMRRLTGQPQ